MLQFYRRHTAKSVTASGPPLGVRNAGRQVFMARQCSNADRVKVLVSSAGQIRAWAFQTAADHLCAPQNHRLKCFIGNILQSFFSEFFLAGRELTN